MVVNMVFANVCGTEKSVSVIKCFFHKIHSNLMRFFWCYLISRSEGLNEMVGFYDLFIQCFLTIPHEC